MLKKTVPILLIMIIGYTQASDKTDANQERINQLVSAAVRRFGLHEFGPAYDKFGLHSMQDGQECTYYLEKDAPELVVQGVSFERGQMWICPFIHEGVQGQLKLIKRSYESYEEYQNLKQGEYVSGMRDKTSMSTQDWSHKGKKAKKDFFELRAFYDQLPVKETTSDGKLCIKRGTFTYRAEKKTEQ